MDKNKKKQQVDKRTEGLRTRSKVENQAEQFILDINAGKTIANFLQEKAKGFIEFLSLIVEDEGEHKGENVFQLVVQREKVNEALAYHFTRLPCEEKERFLDFLGKYSQNGPLAGKNMLWAIAYAAIQGSSALLNTLAENFENVPLGVLLDRLLPLQETAQSDLYSGLNTLGMIAYAAIKEYPALLNALAKNFEKVPPETLLDRLLPLLQEVLQSGPYAGMNTLGMIAYAAVKGHPTLLNALAENFEKVRPERLLNRLLPLLQEIVQSGAYAGMNTVGIIAKAAVGEFPAFLNAITKALMCLKPASRFSLLQQGPPV
ncbi:hypothetical protein CbuD7D7780_00020 [Coxiella burnetii]|uniref:hypothetical protein n=1 Tax=Coxiella burnetii TaxID=777 RepID=UPI0000DADDC1|nr:hypothetical protein [Coxiella burnetii]OYK81078.1 hypothetical protein CbuD7E6568_00020 [Coxiella burnetii]OYK83169.1 hypothetical protein CbuD7D7780_00020 [Coxiella burnetii]